MREPTGACGTVVSMSNWEKVGKAWLRPGAYDSYRFWIKRNSSNRYDAVVEYLDGRVHPKWAVLGRCRTVGEAQELIARLDHE